MSIQTRTGSTLADRQASAQIAKSLRELGLTYSRIGKAMGFSKQWAFRLINNKKPKPQRKRRPVQLGSKQIMTTAEVAGMLGIHCNTARRWAELGVLKACRMGPRGDRRFYRESVENLLKQALSGSDSRAVDQPPTQNSVGETAKYVSPEAARQNFGSVTGDEAPKA